MVNREDLVELIFWDGHEWSCPKSENCKPRGCRECASNILAEYEQKIRVDAINEINNREINIPYSDFARGFKSGYEKGQIIIKEHDAKVRADAFDELVGLIEANYGYDYASDIKPLVEYLKEQNIE